MALENKSLNVNSVSLLTRRVDYNTESNCVQIYRFENGNWIVDGRLNGLETLASFIQEGMYEVIFPVSSSIKFDLDKYLKSKKGQRYRCHL